MATNCSVYKNGQLLGTGSLADGSASITSWVAQGGTPPIARRNVHVTVTGAGAHLSKTFNTRITADNGAGTLSMADKCPHVGA